MIKRLGIVSFLLATSFVGSFAQTFTNEKLLKISSQKLKLEQELNYAKALAMAKQKNWELSINSNGNIAKLTGVDDFGFPVYTQSYNNTIAAATTRASQLWPGGASGLNLSGSTPAMRNKLGVWEFDGLPLASHVEFEGRLVQKDIPTGSSGNDHATHVAGTMIAAGKNPIAKGMAFGIPNMISYDHLNDIAEMTTEAAAGMLVSNHSYGFIAGWNFNSAQSRWEFYGRPGENEDYRYGYYGTDAQRVDSIAFNAPYYLKVSVAGNDRNNNGPAVGQPYFRRNAQGVMADAGARPAGINSNDGFDIILGYGIAKNNLTIGAVNGIPGGYNKPADVVISAFSGWGPADDGRIKPDLVANGVNVTSASTNGNTAYSTKSGTSMAGPNASGSLILLQEHYSKLKAGLFMRSSTLKGLAIHTADEAGGTPGPDYTYGWGLLNVQRAAAVISSAVSNNNSTSSDHLLYENSLNNGETFTKTVVATGKVPLSATIAWTDPPGTINTDATSNLNDRTPKLVHDLDIKITRNTQTFLPWALDATSPSSSASRRINSVDNVERVDVDSTIPGAVYTITVSHKGTLARGTQAYALIVSGTGGVSYGSSASLTSGAKIDSLSLSNIRYSSPTGCKTYTDNTNIIGNIQARQVLPIYFRTSSCDATVNSRIVKVYIDYNNDGDFNDTDELALTSTVQSGNRSEFTSSITIPSTVTIGTIHRMRIITRETTNASDITPTGEYPRGETQDYLLRVETPSNDVSMSNIVSPAAGNCGNDKQYITVAISNNGANPQTNVPITVIVKTGATTVATFNATYPGTIAALSTVDYTLQTPFNALAGTNYIISGETKLSSDQNSTNNFIEVAVPISANADVPVAEGVVCNNSAILRVLNPGNSNYFWYADATTNTPFAVGSSVTTTNVPANRTYYVTREARGSVGAASKLTFPNGGYNGLFGGNFMKFTHEAPFTLESVKMYTSNPGTIKITVGDNLTPGTAAGSYSYRPIASKTFSVFNSRPSASGPLSTALVENNPNDSGFVYNLNLEIPGNGEKIMIAELSDDATIYRNNGITGTIYPFGINGLMSYSGNSVSLNNQNENAFWYFFYDTKVSTGCPSNRVPVVAAPNTPLTVSQVGDSLVANLKTGTFQWIYNDTAFVAGGNGSSIKPTRTGNYKVQLLDALGCSKISANVSYTATAITTVDPREIKLTVSPNPNNGIFQLSFEVTKRSDLSIEILNAAGQRVFLNTQSGFLGKYNKQLSLKQFSSDVYLLKIQHDKKTYLQKVIVQK